MINETAVKQNKKLRDSGLELLRILAIMGVVLLHYNNDKMGAAFSYVKDGTFGFYVSYFSESLCISAVNIFVMLSALFLCKTDKRKPSKIIYLLVQTVVFQLVAYFVDIKFLGGTFSRKGLLLNALPAKYFIILYSVLYLISPYINKALHGLEKEKLKKVALIVFLVFSVATYIVDYLSSWFGSSFKALSTIGLYGSEYGYSIVNFALIYIIGTYLSLGEVKIKKRILIPALIISLAVIFITALVEHKLGAKRINAWNYNNPFVIIFSALAVLLFKEIHFTSRIINALASACFTCFLFHRYIITRVGVETAVSRGGIYLVLHMLAVAVGIFLVSFVVHKLYTLITDLITKPFKNKTQRLDA